MFIGVAKAQEAADVLGLELKTLTSEGLGKAYRLKAKDCHPDHHGSSKLDMWARVSWAKECLDHYLVSHPPVTEQDVKLEGEGNCRACEGTGRVNVRKRGFGPPLTMACIYCRGTGSLEPEEHDFD